MSHEFSGHGRIEASQEFSDDIEFEVSLEDSRVAAIRATQENSRPGSKAWIEALREYSRHNAIDLADMTRAKLYDVARIHGRAKISRLTKAALVEVVAEISLQDVIRLGLI